MVEDRRMYTCEVELPFVRDGVKVMEWRERPVRTLDGTRRIRCLYCHGRVRVHRQNVAGGPSDHVEHLAGSSDVDNCQRGDRFTGTHKMSTDPVE